MYRGVWAVLVQVFCVPEGPPALPAGPGEVARASKPAPAFLAYLKLFFWIGLLAFDGVLIGAWLVLLFFQPIVGIALAIPVWILAIVPDIVVYIALHLRYDTTWYVLSDRSMRVRRGIWVINETTITYENVQNVTVHQGPIQRWYGIANVVVQTAGGGGGPHGQATMTHTGIVEGIADAGAVRDVIMARVKRSQSAGLGDERHAEVGVVPLVTPVGAGWSAEHLAVLKEIGDFARQVAS
jgi:membrane protein YdbS with pleckstrin-like domain